MVSLTTDFMQSVLGLSDLAELDPTVAKSLQVIMHKVFHFNFIGAGIDNFLIFK